MLHYACKLFVKIPEKALFTYIANYPEMLKVKFLCIFYELQGAY